MKGNEDSEWKFAKTSLIMSYIKYGSKRYNLLKIITLNLIFDKDNLIKRDKNQFYQPRHITGTF